MGTLKYLDLANTKVTADGVKELKKVLPRVSITTTGARTAQRRPEQVTVDSIKERMQGTKSITKSIVISYQVSGKDKSITLTDQAEIKSVIDALVVNGYTESWGNGTRHNTIQFFGAFEKLIFEATLEGPTRLILGTSQEEGIVSLEDGKALDLINSLVSKKEDAKIDITKAK
jgi:hypothetical protein